MFCKEEILEILKGFAPLARFTMYKFVKWSIEELCAQRTVNLI